MMGVYLFPLLGGYLADRYWGKYHTILRLSVLYVAGHACLALFDDNPTGFYAGLFLIALGSGGIKPCVAAFVGDQLTEAQQVAAAQGVRRLLLAINVGSLVASLLIPLLLEHLGPQVAFGLPGVLMLIATAGVLAGAPALQGTAARARQPPRLPAGGAQRPAARRRVAGPPRAGPGAGGPSARGGGGGAGGAAGAAGLRLHPVLLDAVRPEGVDLGAAGQATGPAGRARCGCCPRSCSRSTRRWC